MCRRVFGCLFALIVLALAGVAYLAFYSPAPRRAVKIAVGKPQQARAEKRVEIALAHPVPVPIPTPNIVRGGATPSKARDARTASSVGAYERQYSVRLSQDDLNTVLATNPAVVTQLHRVKIQSASLQFAAPDDVTLSASLPVGRTVREVSLSGTLAPSKDGGVEFHASGGLIGRLPLPVSSEPSIDARAAKLLALALPKLPIAVRSVSVANGALILTGPKR